MKAKAHEILPSESHQERFIEPETPEHPLIRLRKIETDCFQAEFALELEGVSRKKTPQETGKKEDEKNDSDASRYWNTLVTVLSEGQGLEFVYHGGKDAQGKPSFDWRINGSSRGESSSTAAASAKRLFQNMNVVLKAIRNDYSFLPVINAELLDRKTGEEGWKGVIRPMGIEINAGYPLPMGFVNNVSAYADRSSVIITAHDSKAGQASLDAVAVGAVGCPSEVRLIVSARPFALTEKGMRRIASAMKWLRNGEVKQINFHPSVDEGIEDEELLKRLKNNLESWMKTPYGYRITCNVLSSQPIPGSYLSLIGRDLFNCPVSISMEKVFDREKEYIPSDDILDLRDAVNSALPIPPLFPDKSILLNCGVKRVYTHQMLRHQTNGILLGHANGAASQDEVRFARQDRSRHVYICGATGTGKSTLLYNMIMQDIKNGEGVTVIDPHGDLYQQVLNSIPNCRKEDVALVDLCDFEYSVGINFLECNEPYKSVQMNYVVNEMIKIFDRLYDLHQTGGPIFEQYMRNALLLVMDNEVEGATLMDIPWVFEDKEYRRFLQSRCKNPLVVNFWKMQAEKAGGEASLENIAPYITSKLNQFTNNALLMPIISQSKSTINFRETMDQGKILLVNLSKGLLGELDTQLLGMLIIGKMFSSAMGRVILRPENRKPIFLYVDEFQNFTTDSVAHLLSEARKFGIYLTLANQNLAQLSANKGRQNILDAVL
ncbi:MAG: type IV secretion system DNA-binding domain-containing protein, partial [Nitrospirota bacterium]